MDEAKPRSANGARHRGRNNCRRSEAPIGERCSASQTKQPSGVKSTMYCVLDYCPSKVGDPVSFHKFPRDEEQRNAWRDFIRAAGRRYWTPRKTSLLCSLHFSSDSYQTKYAASFGIPKKRLLVPGAVPTVYPAAAQSLLPSESGATAPKRQCVAEVDSDGVILFKETAMEETSSTTARDHCPSISSPRVASATIGSSTCDSQTQCAVQVSLKSTQVPVRPKMRSIDVQTEGSS
ncbi:THAP domain-containing protein 5 [Rhipicephalus sanguineus]|uniref:THAP domain-containing protein 5 n=1 Tax=Rhipicephalus sanguineus TaxID=34632 RepID=UPI00189456DB|nr:THAP domain-containing protein 5 [Rhipicephalus sanguineus]